MKVEVALFLPRESETLGLIRRIVTDSLTTVGVLQPCIDDITLALTEACTNVLQHAAADDEFEVRLDVDDHRCAIAVSNAGDGFVSDGLTGAMPDPSSARGRGVAIMRAVMDQVAFATEPATGTIVRLVKDLAVRPESALARLARPAT